MDFESFERRSTDSLYLADLLSAMVMAFENWRALSGIVIQNSFYQTGFLNSKSKGNL